MQELDKFNFKINVIPNGLEKYMSFTINKKLIFIEINRTYQDFKQKGFYTYEYISDFEKFKEEFLGKKRFIVPPPTEKLLAKNMIMF